MEIASGHRKTREVSPCSDGDGSRRGLRGKAKYLLSGLLKCATCGANYIFSDARSYCCSSYLNGRACSNGIRVRRDALESTIVGPIADELLHPDRVRRMAAEMQKRFTERAAAAIRGNADVPRELADVDARLDRLRQRLRAGDPDLTDDELQAAISRVESKRAELAAAQSKGRVPDAAGSAAACRRYIVVGVTGFEPATYTSRT